MAKKNIALLKRLRTRFLRMRHPKHFRMKQIAVKTDCGAAMCFIGHTLDLSGFKMRLKPEIVNSDEAARCDYEFISPGGRVVRDPYDKAAQLLGLTISGESWMDDGEASNFFHDFSIKTPKQAAARIAQLINA